MKVYAPAEDSFLLCDVVEKYLKNKNKEKLKVLDLGYGSGIQSENVIRLGIKQQNILAVDINAEALKKAKKLGIKTKKSNLFENINQKFDLIIFNPPYLPENKYDSQADTTGGKKGDEIIIKFINELKFHLTKTGTALLLTSSHTPENWKSEVKKQNLKTKKSAEKSLFFEKLFVWELWV